MSQATILALVALAASVLLLLKKESRLWAIVAVVAAGIMVAAAFGLLSISIAGLDLGLILGGALVVAGGFLFAGVREKIRVACATAIILTGALLLVSSLGLF